MNVILNKDVPKVGKEGDIVTVSEGYGRNYLFARGLAVEASGGALKQVQLRQAQEERKAEKLLAQAQKDQATLAEKKVTITSKAGSGDRLFGSITSGDIVEAVKKQYGVVIEKRKVLLLDPIKAIGSFTVEIKLHKDITVPVGVEVVKA
jgi:large subunit ribosomal protein L9